MSRFKNIKDQLTRFFSDSFLQSKELFELKQYFENYGSIEFKFIKQKNQWIAVSTNFIHGSIITSANTKSELEKSIEDAILTSFSVPASYREEAGINKLGARSSTYAPTIQAT